MIVIWLLKFRVSFLRIPVVRHIHLQSGAMKNKNNTLPDRWTQYIPIGRRITGTRFIAFKVPLASMYNNRLSPWQRFTPSDLVMEVEKQNEELGLIVDLTCTERYYSPSELPRNIKHLKIFTMGKAVPSDEVIKKFKSTVKQYLSQNSENNKLVGVHCTHGLNRTGYLICRYLIDVQSMDPSEAIERFNNSRGHCIERSNYLDDLLTGQTRSNAGLDEPQVETQEYLPIRNANSMPPHPKEQPWRYDHSNETPRQGPWASGPPFAHQRFPHQRFPPHHRGQMNGPRHGFSHSYERFPSNPQAKNQQHLPKKNANSMPPHPEKQPRRDGNAGLDDPQAKKQKQNPNSMPPHPEKQPRRDGGPTAHQHDRHRPNPQHRDYDGVNGAPSQDYRPQFPQQSPKNPGSFPAQPPQPQQQGKKKPYKRHPKPGLKNKPMH
ncbi:RNA/RNP complex-1-interacting phosphatase isoform 2-T2 [Leptodactylus fuscus]|uniref:RNA/RNP complex-1-interacting phosphatase isoform X2 n=1 Tax=Leptodactylus fuscus TaxID=238119 RepID=UPI003F4EDD48